MMQSKRRSAGLLWFCLIISLIFIWTGFAGVIDSVTGPYYDPAEFVLCVILFGIGLRLFIIALHYFDKLIIDHETLYVKTFFNLTRKKIQLPSIQYWTEKVGADRGLRYFKWSIYGEKRLYTINTRFYQNQEAIIAAVASFGYRNIEMENKAGIKKYSLISMVSFILSGIVLLVSVYFFFKAPEPPVTPAQISTIKGVLSEDPIVVKGSKGVSHITFGLESYPQFTFNVSGQAYTATYVDVFKQRMEQGDSIFVDMDKTEFQKKISHEIPLGFFDKTVGYTTIHVIQMKGKGLIFLNLNDYNAAHIQRNNKGLSITLIILCICLILMGRQQRLKATKMMDT